MGAVRKLEAAVVGVLILVIFASIVIQVVSRYLFDSPLSWPEELAKFCFIWAIFLGAAIGLARRAHIAVEVLIAGRPRRLRLAARILVEAVVIALLVVLVKAGIDMTQLSMTSQLPALGLPLAAIYLPVPVAALLMIAESLLRVRSLLAGEEQEAGDQPA